MWLYHFIFYLLLNAVCIGVSAGFIEDSLRTWTLAIKLLGCQTEIQYFRHGNKC